MNKRRRWKAKARRFYANANRRRVVDGNLWAIGDIVTLGTSESRWRCSAVYPVIKLVPHAH